jgi:hypothetical protein
MPIVKAPLVIRVPGKTPIPKGENLLGSPELRVAFKKAKAGR